MTVQLLSGRSSLGAPFTRGEWTPWLLGPTKLLGWWNADRTDLITMPAGVVSSWKDSVAGYILNQTVEADKPLWTGTGFNGLPVVTFDGVSEYLTGTYPVGFPSGAAAIKSWMVCDQKTSAASTTSTYLGCMGGGSLNNSRGFVRAVVSGVNRARCVDTSGGTGNSVTQSVTDFSGRFVALFDATGTTIGAEIAGVAATPVASVPAILNTKLRMAANQATTAAAFANVGIRHYLFTVNTTAAEDALMRAYLSRGV